MSVTEAARIYNLTEDVLTRLIQDGRINAAQLPSGELLVSDQSLNEKTKEQIIEDKYGHLKGKPITISEAMDKYRIPQDSTIRRWITKGYIEVVDDGYPMRVDEAEVAYCTSIYHQRQAAGIRSGAPLLNEDGTPYQLKHPELSKQRRRNKKHRHVIS
jgi:predicted site-specific integrase-resolvase